MVSGHPGRVGPMPTASIPAARPRQAGRHLPSGASSWASREERHLGEGCLWQPLPHSSSSFSGPGQRSSGSRPHAALRHDPRKKTASSRHFPQKAQHVSLRPRASLSHWLLLEHVLDGRVFAHRPSCPWSGGGLRVPGREGGSCADMGVPWGQGE